MKRVGFLILVAVVIAFASCNKQDYKTVMHNPDLYCKAMHELNYVVIYDIFSPPVAARVFAYSNLAAYETLAKEGGHYASLEGKIRDLEGIPSPAKPDRVDFPFASVIAMMTVGRTLTFSEDRMDSLIDSVKTLAANSNMTKEMFDSSVSYGSQVAAAILNWSKKDNYGKTRGSKFTVTGLDGHWSPTPPGYFDAVEPKWMTIRTMALDSPNIFPIIPPPAFSKDSGSAFYKMARKVYDTVNALNETQQWIANFWDCNSFKMHQEGHVMFATKAMTPGGHWMEITGTIAMQKKSDWHETVYAYTGASMAIFDGFIDAWWCKYHWDLIRPETYINQYIDPNWKPFLQTPPFPEYISAHSVISAGAAQFLARTYGDSTAFKDSSERDWGWPDRNFSSFTQAAWEVSMSRFYGGIHYYEAIVEGRRQGRFIGDMVMDKLLGPSKQLAKRN
ncbi:MAG TPA: vanadium-dependent haloperoxidase [Parafilimonas sp.]|nr:vanadium-dependent haloperoxidase [Parafilimonas sp.]